jgi:acyl-CoA thioesterase-1
MKKSLCVFFIVFGVLHAQDITKKTDAKKREPGPVLKPIEDVPGLPRVLLIGDSISMGYTMPVRKLLEGKANVHRIPQNVGSSKNGVTNLEKWLGTGKWDVIHFNHGIHDLKIMPDGKRQVEPADYEKNLRDMVARFKQTGANLIFATTTPIPNRELKPARKFGKVSEYNEIATRVMKENGVHINDLNAWSAPRFTELQMPDDLLYNPEGSAFLAEKVAKEIQSALSK